MLHFWRMRSLQKFVLDYSSVHNHFNYQRNIERRAGFKSLRDAATANGANPMLPNTCCPEIRGDGFAFDSTVLRSVSDKR